MENTQVGPFLILERLGNSRRQKVYRARQTEQNIDVALKFIGIPDDSIRAKAIDKIQIEIDVLKQLQHPNLVQMLGAGVEEDRIFFASELIKSESLTRALSRRGKFAADLVVDYGRQIAELLHYLHGQDIIHSKLTPDKILITRDGLIKVADLRLNRSRRRRWDSSRKRELDIAAYMAPEQFKEGATAKSDIYSLGVVLYEMLTGRLPYEPDTLGRMARKKMQAQPPSVSEQVMDCPVWLDKLVTRMITPDPRKRPHSAKEVILAFDELKRIDKTKKAAVTQVSGNFNALTAGTDKSEANRLLGKKVREKSDLPIFQSFGFLIAGLVLIAAILVFAMLPASSKKSLDRAQQLMNSDDPGAWIDARDYLKKIISKGEDDSLFEEAEDLYFESRRRSLVLQAEKGRKFALQSLDSQRFLEGVRFQMDGDLENAEEVFAGLLETVDPVGKERHIYLESQTRLQRVVELIKRNTIRSALESIENLQSISTREDLQDSLENLTEILSKYGGDADFREIVDAAQEVFNENRIKLDNLEQAATAKDDPN